MDGRTRRRRAVREAAKHGHVRDVVAETAGTAQQLGHVREIAHALVSAYALIGEVDNGGDVTRLYCRIGSPHAGHAALGAVDDPDS
jgi:hypothetical protein